jgi:acyl-CoA reductase-like NAD-dependent aldehyde dehydrogenase
MSLLAPQRLMIGGERADAVDQSRFEVLDPSTGEIITEVPRGKAADVDRAVAAARNAFEGWRRTAPAQRGRLLTAAAQRLREQVTEMSRLGSLDGGLPLPAVERDVEATARYLEYYGGLADKIGGDVVPLGMDYLNYTEREPWGVCAVILPYNSPFQILARSLAPALAAGNVVVAKAAEQAPLGPLRLAEVLEDEGFPPGVINIVTGFGSEAGARLVSHEDVDRITFTGSEPTGRQVMHAATANLTPVTLELGGKSPQIIFADADIDLAAQTVVSSLVTGAGQICSAGTRMLVERAVHDQVVEAVVEHMRATRVGPAVDSPDMGPLITARQRDSVREAIDRASATGAKLLTGGTRPPDGTPDGYYVAPTLFDEVDPASALAQEEIFGPVLAVMDFDTAEEAVALADGTRFGLIAGLWTRDLARAHRVARELRCGQVFVNTYSAGTGIELPFGGFKKSGIGREKGITGYLEYTQIKNICVKVDQHG